MFEQSNAQLRDPITDWVLRAGICLMFFLFGLDKFSNGSQWVAFFAQIGLGDWFRYFTGVVEIAGALLVLIPRAITAGLVLLTCAMAGAAVVHIFVMHHPGNAVFPTVFLAGLVLFWLQRRSRLAARLEPASDDPE